MNFNGGRLAREEYPYEYYKEFLEYLIGNYNGEYWNTVPKEVTKLWRVMACPLNQRSSPRDFAGSTDCTVHLQRA